MVTRGEMKHDIMGKKIVGLQGWGTDEFTIEFDDGVRVLIKPVVDVGLSKGRIVVSATIEVSTRKVELTVEV